MSRIHVFPNWKSNPYLNMLYIGVRSEGWTVEGSTQLDELNKSLTSLTEGDIFHIQWTSPILQGAPNWREAKEALSRFRRAVDGAKERGVIVLWTVHNSIPHGVKYIELEIELALYLSETSTRILQLSTGTRKAVSEFYELPIEKLTTLRHASYVGIYSDPPDQVTARVQLGVPLSSPTIGFVGQMRGYKGVSSLLRAARQTMDRVSDLTLLLAGKTEPAEVARISSEVPPGLRAIRHHGFVPSEELGLWFAAADVMVFPYERILNSGSMFLSATFSRLCILPAAEHLVDEFGEQPWVRFYEPEASGDRSLSAVIEESLASAISARESAQKFAEEYTTVHMAWDYVRIVASLEQESRATEAVNE